MDKIKRYFILAVMLLAMIKPPIDMNFKVTLNPHSWLYLALGMGVISFLIAMTKISVWLRLFTVWALVNTVIGQYTVQSFWFLSFFIAGMLFYLLAYNTDITAKQVSVIFPAVMLVNLLFMALQQWEIDPLFKGVSEQKILYGAVGEPMRMASFAVCSCAFLAIYRKWLVLPVIALTILLSSSGAFAAIMTGVVFYGVVSILKYYRHKLLTGWLIVTLLVISIAGISTMFLYIDGKYQFFERGDERWAAWKKTMCIANHRPIRGWGLDTFKILFPVNSKDLFKPTKAQNALWRIGDQEGDWLIWREAHNDWLQMYFEMGLVGMFIAIGFMVTAFVRFFRSDKSETLIIIMSGLVICAFDMVGHFPIRMVRTAPIIIMLLVLFEKNLKERRT